MTGLLVGLSITTPGSFSFEIRASFQAIIVRASGISSRTSTSSFFFFTWTAYAFCTGNIGDTFYLVTCTVGSWKIHFIIDEGSEYNLEFAGEIEFTTPPFLLHLISICASTNGRIRMTTFVILIVGCMITSSRRFISRGLLSIIFCRMKNGFQLAIRKWGYQI